MKALVIHENAVVNVENVAETSLSADSIKVKVNTCGICGSDVPRVLDNKAHYYPIILGHEFSGIVTAIGDNVKNVNIGDHVVGIPLIPCYKCNDCHNGNYSLCKNYQFVGSRLSGGMAEYIVIPKENVKRIPDDLNLQDAAMIEPLTVAIHAFYQNHHKEGKKVAVFGMGTIGCFVAQVAKAIGAENITAFVRNHKYDNLLADMGITSVVNTQDKDWLEQVNHITNGRGFDFIYETAGSTQTMQQCFEVAGNKASVCFIGTPKKELSFTVKMWEMLNRKEFYLTGSWMSYSAPFPGTEWNDAVKYLENGQVKIYPGMVHSVTKLINAADVFEEYKSGGTVNGRKLIVME